MDLFGPLKNSKDGNAYVLVITDAFTKLVHLKAIPDKSAKTVAAAILDKFIYVFGIPDAILTDQGREFINEFSNRIWDSLKINHKVTSPYHPQTNAQAEVFNKTMAHYLRTVMVESETSKLDWELFLGPLTLSHNTAVNKSTMMTPFYATFGLDPKLPLWVGLDKDPVEDEQGKTMKKDLRDELARIQKSQDIAHRVLVQNNQHARQTYTDQHNKHTDTAFPDYVPGQAIWVKIQQKPGPNPKLGPTYEKGIVIQRKGDNTFLVSRPDRVKRKLGIMNSDHFKIRNPDTEDTSLDEPVHSDVPAHLPPPVNDDDQDDSAQEEPEQLHQEPTQQQGPHPSGYGLRRRGQDKKAMLHALVDDLAEVATLNEIMTPTGVLDLSRLDSTKYVHPALLLELLQAGFTIQGSTPAAAAPQFNHNAPPPLQPQTRPRTSRSTLALRRLRQHLQTPAKDKQGTDESEQSTSRTTRSCRSSSNKPTPLHRRGQEWAVPRPQTPHKSRPSTKPISASKARASRSPGRPTPSRSATPEAPRETPKPGFRMRSLSGKRTLRKETVQRSKSKSRQDEASTSSADTAQSSAGRSHLSQMTDSIINWFNPADQDDSASESEEDFRLLT
jgi:hypothetical protein